MNVIRRNLNVGGLSSLQCIPVVATYLHPRGSQLSVIAVADRAGSVSEGTYAGRVRLHS